MAKIFDSVPVAQHKRNKFDLSRDRKLTMEMGYLIPTFLEEMVPGDKFRVTTETFIRMAPMLAPVMHRFDCTTHYFKVPVRLLWNEWEDFITGGRLGDAAPVHPYIEINNTTKAAFVKGSVADHFGINITNPNGVLIPDITQPLRVSALPFRAYQLIWNTYYRDQNLSVPVPFTFGSGDVSAEYPLLCGKRLRCFEKDYFTSCLPFAQRGGEVELPILGTATADDMRTGDIRNTAGGGLASSGNLESNAGVLQVDDGSPADAYMDVIGTADVEAGVTINDLRRSIQLQKFLENQARGGSRYNETILVQFGIKTSDARLQRPEYLGGGKMPLKISEVVSTYQNTADENGYPQGNMAGHGVGLGSYAGFESFFEEHCYVIGITSILPRTGYSQGIHRMWQRFDKFDWYWPLFANIGEQEVKVGELWSDYAGLPGEATATFGYQSRFAEYKYGLSSIHGDMRDQFAYWHASRLFSSTPTLNTDFVDADPINRIFAVQDVPEGTDHFWVQMFNRVDALRPMPYYGVPSI